MAQDDARDGHTELQVTQGHIKPVVEGGASVACGSASHTRSVQVGGSNHPVKVWLGQKGLEEAIGI